MGIPVGVGRIRRPRHCSRAHLHHRWRRRAKAEDRELVQDRINRARKDVDRLAHEVLKGRDVSAEQNSAAMSVAPPRKRSNAAPGERPLACRDRRRGHRRRLRRDQPRPARPKAPHVFALDAVPKAQRRRTKITATSPQGKPVVISNTTTRPAPGRATATTIPRHVRRCPVPGGWYPYLFWTGGWTWPPPTSSPPTARCPRTRSRTTVTALAAPACRSTMPGIPAAHPAAATLHSCRPRNPSTTNTFRRRLITARGRWRFGADLHARPHLFDRLQWRQLRR